MDLTDAYTCPGCNGIRPHCTCDENYWSEPSPKVKCWQIEPYHDNQADFCIVPIRGEESHHKALEYAKQRLEEQWDATAHDETIEPKVTMKIITMTEAEISEIEDYV